jgi:RNA 2',3'-cyclic 3'-phosphodiesterase
MRIFIALDLDDGVRARIELFMNDLRGFAPDARWARPESLHITLKFIGNQSAEQVVEIRRALARISAGPAAISIGNYGFFPTSDAARVFWLGVEGDPQLAALAKSVDNATSAVDVPRQEHAFAPHLTLARRRGSGAPSWRKEDAPNRSFQHLQEKLAAMPTPEFGTMTAREFLLYESQLGPGGSRYTKIACFGLK